MKHTLVIPTDLIEKLNVAHDDYDCHERWLEIGIDTAEEMLNAVLTKMNEQFTKLSISSYRTEDKYDIKNALNNSGNASKYLGYLEKEDGNIDGLFFYNEPQTSTGNDLMTRNIWPSLIGIYKNISDSMVDLRFSSRPVYIVNLNETSRMANRGVKVNIICAMLSGFNYVDMFDNPILDIVPTEELSPVDYVLDDGTFIEVQQSARIIFNTLESLNNLIHDNDYFEIYNDARVMRVLSSRFESSNPSAEVYRFCPKIIPAAYIAKDNKFQIDIDALADVNSGNIDILKSYLRKFNNQ